MNHRHRPYHPLNEFRHRTPVKVDFGDVWHDGIGELLCWYLTLLVRCHLTTRTNAWSLLTARGTQQMRFTGLCLIGLALQATSWFQEFNKLEEQLRDAASEAFHLQESIRTKEIDSDVEPIMASIRSVLGPLNLHVQQSV